MIARPLHRRPDGLLSAPRHGVARILVAKLAGQPTRGKLIVGSEVIPCALGRAGIAHRKREGDGATPAGRFAIVGLWTRQDRTPPLRAGLPHRRIRPDDGWCDDPAVPLYNRAVRLPVAASHETLWRADALYDVVLILDYNLSRPLKGRGSAIFFHVAHDDWRPTAGCVAIRRDAMRRLLPRLSRRSILTIGV